MKHLKIHRKRLNLIRPLLDVSKVSEAICGTKNVGGRLSIWDDRITCLKCLRKMRRGEW